MWPFTQKHWVFQPPLCICEDIEAHVRDACALRDEMTAWDTPLNEWKKLQQMQVLVPKAKPEFEIRQAIPYVEIPRSDWANLGMQVSTSSAPGVFTHNGTRQSDLLTNKYWRVDTPPKMYPGGIAVFSIPIPDASYIDIGWTILWNAESYQVRSISIGVTSASVETQRLGTQLPTYDGKLCIKLQPGEPFEVGSIITRGETRYQITERLFDNTNRVMARQLSRWRL
jgi:hypothetical protein